MIHPLYTWDFVLLVALPLLLVVVIAVEWWSRR